MRQLAAKVLAHASEPAGQNSRAVGPDSRWQLEQQAPSEVAVEVAQARLAGRAGAEDLERQRGEARAELERARAQF